MLYLILNLIKSTTSKIDFPVKKAHWVGNSLVLTIDPIHIKRLHLDDWKFFSQEPIENGILLKVMTLESDKEYK